MKQTRWIKTGSAIGGTMRGGSDGGVATGTIGNTAKAATA